MGYQTILLLCSASLTAVAAPAAAQVAGGAPVQEPPAQSAADDPGPGQDQAGEIIVTGSRIKRDGYSEPTPVTVADISQIQTTSPSTIQDGLNKLPAFQGSSSSNSQLDSRQATSGNFLNLRNFGSVRSLILQDGRRLPPTNYLGLTDSNIIPQLLIERVEVVTGGVSAIYGSDAVAGVVNFIIDKKFEGLRGVAQAGVSQLGDSGSQRIGLAFGKSLFGGRGHFLASAEHNANDGIHVHEDRAYGRAVYIYDGQGTQANPYRLVSNVRFTNSTQGGLVQSGPFAGQQFNSAGQLVSFTPGTPLRTSNLGIGGDGAYYRDNTQNVPITNDQLFGRFQFDFGEGFKAFIQSGYTRARTRFVGGIVPLTGNLLTIYSGNAFLPASAQSQLTNAGVGSFTVNRLSSDLSTNLADFRQTTSSWISTAGLEGRMGGFNWELSYTFGRAETNSVLPHNLNWQRFYAAVDAVRDPAGNIVCRVSLTSPNLYPGCVPLNLFGENAASSAALNYISGKTLWNAVNKNHNVVANISGKLFDGWAGPVSVALTGEYRKQSLVLTSNATPLVPADFTGLRGGFSATTPPGGQWRFGTVPPQHGQNDVWEGGGELSVPLLRDFVIAKNLQLDLAGRYTKYSSGGVTTWKIGGVYEPVDGVRVRVTRSKDIRAPTLYDLYASNTLIAANFNDPHTGVNGILPVQGSGNPNLRPEIAKTWTAGVVFAPRGIPNLQLSVDYFDIKIANAISTIAGNVPTVASECEKSNGTSPVCAVIVRPLPFDDRSPANFPTLLLSQARNVASLETRGVDVEASYRFDMGDVGALNLRVLATYQPILRTQAFPNSAVLDAAGTVGTPSVGGGEKWKGSLFLDYTRGPFTLNWLTRYSGKLRRGNGDNSSSIIFADGELPAATFSDANVSYRIGQPGPGELTVFFNVTNVFNRSPRISPGLAFSGVPGFGSTTTVPGDDNVGRAFVTGVRFRF